MSTYTQHPLLSPNLCRWSVITVGGGGEERDKELTSTTIMLPMLFIRHWSLFHPSREICSAALEIRCSRRNVRTECELRLYQSYQYHLVNYVNTHLRISKFHRFVSEIRTGESKTVHGALKSEIVRRAKTRIEALRIDAFSRYVSRPDRLGANFTKTFNQLSKSFLHHESKQIARYGQFSERIALALSS